jgi:hypothetical protein
MEDLPQDDADVGDSLEQVEESGPDGALEFLLPMTYVPQSTPDKDQVNGETEAQAQREDMEKTIWSQGVI